MRAGVLAAVGAYGLWGLLPVFWRALGSVPALQVLLHRVAWSFLFLVVVLAIRRQWAWLRQMASSRTTLLTFLGTGSLLALNWFVYIWAVQTGHVVDASLGYFVNPLISVLLGTIALKERLRLGQWAAIGLAAGGVAFLTVGYGAFPWIGLTLAGTFGLYGLLRKTASLGSLEGLSAEMGMLFLPALAGLAWLEWSGQGWFGHSRAGITALLCLTGVVTAIPLLLFAFAVRQVRLSTMGLLQYIAPTLQFLLGVLAFGEELGTARLIGFGIIWVALAIYSAEGILQGRHLRPRFLALR
jgi:chloramphenicol-sensitive protein RarD